MRMASFKKKKKEEYGQRDRTSGTPSHCCKALKMGQSLEKFGSKKKKKKEV